jgi:hypothetical protein
MSSPHPDVIVADAIVKDVEGFDPQVAYAAIRKDAFTAPGNATRPSDVIAGGREGLGYWISKGYVVFIAALGTWS